MEPTAPSAQRRADGWFLTFRVAYSEQLNTSVFSMTFYDAEGNAWETHQMGFTASGDARQDSSIMLPLPGYQDGEVWLEAGYSHTTAEKGAISPCRLPASTRQGASPAGAAPP